MAGPVRQVDMDAVFSVTDAMGISREAITVPLGRKDPGGVTRLGGDQIRIVIPASIETDAWLPTLREALAELGIS